MVFTFSDLGVGFFGAHHSNPIFMPFPKWYNTYSPHLTWRLSLFFRRVPISEFKKCLSTFDYILLLSITNAVLLTKFKLEK